MSPAHLRRQLHLVACIAAFSFAAFADGASPQAGALPSPERAAASHPAPAKAMSARTAKSFEPTARPSKRLTSPARPEKAVPSSGTAADRAQDLESRGNFAMQAGQTAEAVAAFEHALKLAPSRTDTWGKLAFLYLKEGNSAKAVEAFKKAKLLGDANGGMVTRDASGALLFP